MAHGVQTPESGTFVIIGPQKKVIKLLSNERVDAEFLCRCFRDVADIKSEDILGLRTKSGLLVRLTNPKLNEVIDGKVCTLEVYPSAPPLKKQKISNSSSKATKIATDKKKKKRKENKHKESESLFDYFPHQLPSICLTKMNSESEGIDNGKVIKFENDKSVRLRRWKTAWMLFNAFKLAELKQEYPSEHMGERTKRSAAIWHKMTDTEKAVWHKKELQEKTDYQKMKKQFDEHQDYSKVPSRWLKKVQKKQENAVSNENHK